MFLGIDIGNTNIAFGIFNGKRLIKRFNINSISYNKAILRKKIRTFKIDSCIICSVVPRITPVIKRDVLSLAISGARIYVVGRNIKVPLKNLYHRPKQVGHDRLVNAFAGLVKFGAPLIIVDLGTAITFDIVSGKHEYLGGIILPGFGISLRVLHEKTALLPAVRLNKPGSLIGKNTKSSILSGIVYGYASLIGGLLSLLKKDKLLHNAKVIGTGGDIDFIKKYCRKFNNIDGNLTLKGLCLLYEKTLKERGNLQ
ncbi:MAG: type III pantothenate kinase [Candidatus Omnitrophica bacterium]|nr:type III pantothenate kinase [Candidatus Omnitrophota bacterium]